MRAVEDNGVCPLRLRDPSGCIKEFRSLKRSIQDALRVYLKVHISDIVFYKAFRERENKPVNLIGQKGRLQSLGILLQSLPPVGRGGLQTLRSVP